MKTKSKPESELLPPGSPIDEKVVFIVQRRHEPNAPLTKEMSEQLGWLAEKKDADINYSDIPELSDEQLAEFSNRHPSSRLFGGKLLAKVDKAS